MDAKPAHACHSTRAHLNSIDSRVWQGGATAGHRPQSSRQMMSTKPEPTRRLRIVTTASGTSQLAEAAQHALAQLLDDSDQPEAKEACAELEHCEVARLPCTLR
eukprot:NODE_27599_length_507_cov_3.350000.p1 GENE.NODE_27599_length_507_cov_3.350000~~NODE_27599_length_507_cov_3.350000.p1  ORF type:complete len:104 (-),score=9.71 NODE_27599_length_507_cov_3.350000:5-316(-)